MKKFITTIHKSIEIFTLMFRICKKILSKFDEKCKKIQMKTKKFRKNFMKTYKKMIKKNMC